MPLLSPEKINNGLKKIPDWSFKKNQIGTEFHFKDFTEALDFVNKVGSVAEEMNHHPDILLHSWNRVNITVSTHDEGGVTEKDFILAKMINEFV